MLAPGSKAVDFARYVAWEINLEVLRQKRTRRMRVKSKSAHTGQARIFQIFDRGTRKHPGDLALWISYLDYCKQARATSKFKAVLTAALRLHPTQHDLWLYAARWSMEAEADVNGARSYLQRGTRFCITTKHLWIEYAQLEMFYLARIFMRRRILGLDSDHTTKDQSVLLETQNGTTTWDPTDDMISLAHTKLSTAEQKSLIKLDVDAEAKQNPMTTPVLRGAIPLAIFAAARKQPFFTATVAGEFFDMFTRFDQVPCLADLLEQVLEVMKSDYATEFTTWSCYLKQPLVGHNAQSSGLPAALRTLLRRLPEALQNTKDKPALCAWLEKWLSPMLLNEELDPAIRTVLEHIISRTKV